MADVKAPPTEEAHGSITTYTIGFALSVVLTLGAYFSVVNDVMSGWSLVWLLAGLAVVQLLVQLVFFLHLGQESKPRWNLVLFLFTVMVVGILVLGSLWIMKNLDYHMMRMPAEEAETYMNENQGL